MKLKIKKGDTVAVIAGSSKGKQGRVLAVYPTEMRILVEGVNIRKRAVKPNPANPEGGIIPMEMPIHYSNVMLVGADGKPVRDGKRA